MLSILKPIGASPVVHLYSYKGSLYNTLSVAKIFSPFVIVNKEVYNHNVVLNSYCTILKLVK